MNKYLKTYIHFVYDYYMKEDFNVLNKIGKFLIYPAWLFRNFLVILYSIFCFPLVLFHMGYLYFEPIYEKRIKDLGIYDKLTKS